MARKHNLTNSLARISRSCGATKRAAERALREHYRAHRRLKWGPLTSVLDAHRVMSIVFWGELEHRTGAVAIALVLGRLSSAAKAIIGRLGGRPQRMQRITNAKGRMKQWQI